MSVLLLRLVVQILPTACFPASPPSIAYCHYATAANDRFDGPRRSDDDSWLMSGLGRPHSTVRGPMRRCRACSKVDTEPNLFLSQIAANDRSFSLNAFLCLERSLHMRFASAATLTAYGLAVGRQDEWRAIRS